MLNLSFLRTGVTAGAGFGAGSTGALARMRSHLPEWADVAWY